MYFVFPLRREDKEDFICRPILSGPHYRRAQTAMAGETNCTIFISICYN